MLNILFISLLYFSWILSFFSNQPVEAEKESITIMAYYVAPRDNYQPDKLPLDQLTHIIYSFTQVFDNEMKFQNPEAGGKKLASLVHQKKNHPHIKVMIACGGWGGSGGFSDMAATPENRKKFVDSVIRFIQKYNLDGLDIDWEYPGLRGAGNPYRPEDKENFTALMRELKTAMNAVNKDLVLSFASAGWERYYEHIELQEVMKYADYMNVMTYDQVGGQTPYTGHHTSLGWIKPEDMDGTPAKAMMEARGRTPNPRSAEKIIHYCMEKGVDPSQIVIGAAFYGRGWKGVSSENNGLYQKNNGVWIGWAAYKNIRENHEGKNGFTRYWDPIAKAPYLYNPKDSLFISYDDTVSVKLKTQYAIDTGLGGIMFWQLGDDTDDSGLLDAIYNAATK